MWGPIQRRSGLSCVRQVYFLRKPTEFHDMRTGYQIINNYHSFITVLIISRKSPAIARSLAP